VLPKICTTYQYRLILQKAIIVPSTTRIYKVQGQIVLFKKEIILLKERLRVLVVQVVMLIRFILVKRNIRGFKKGLSTINKSTMLVIIKEILGKLKLTQEKIHHITLRIIIDKILRILLLKSHEEINLKRKDK
jgi:hypothetical protein